MRSEFSEIGYSFALIRELIASRGFGIAPYFPTLQEENWIGADVGIERNGVVFFFQFKLSEYLVRKSAWEHKYFNLSVPIFRMKITNTLISPQHNLLVDLEKMGGEVFYATPYFYLYSDYWYYCHTLGIINNSMFFRPSAIGYINDTLDHHVSYYQNGTGFFFSEPKSIDDWLINGEKFLDTILQSFSSKSKRMTDRYFTELLERVMIYPEFNIPEKIVNDEVGSLTKLSNYLKMNFSIETVLFFEE